MRLSGNFGTIRVGATAGIDLLEPSMVYQL